ncbi:hypothetical protein [Streptomyces anulatus]|uniref:hypothetical protein n=1 Tax=Streptomyces anulatus TaxID=1892 RepID=UPI0004C5818C
MAAVAALFPAVLALIPVATLAGVLIHAGAELIPVLTIRQLRRDHRGEDVVLLVTAPAIVLTDMFLGVLLGVGMAVVKTAWEAFAVRLDTDEQDDRTTVTLSGSASFLRLPLILDTLADGPVELDLTRMRHVDHACRTALEVLSPRGGTVGDPVPATDGTPREAALAAVARDGEGHPRPESRRRRPPGRPGPPNPEGRRPGGVPLPGDPRDGLGAGAARHAGCGD